jgi:hypothetical protein
MSVALRRESYHVIVIFYMVLATEMEVKWIVETGHASE